MARAIAPTPEPVPVDPLDGATALEEPTTAVIELTPTSVSDGPVIDEVVAPDGATRAIARPYSVTLIDVTSGATRWRAELVAGLPRLAFSRDGARLAVLGLGRPGPHETSFAVLDARTGAVRSSATLYVPGVRAPQGSRMGSVSFGAHAIVPDEADTGFDLLGSRRAPIVVEAGGRAFVDVERAVPIDTIDARPVPVLPWDRLDVSADEQVIARSAEGLLEWVDPRGAPTSCALDALGITRIAGVGFEGRRAWLLTGGAFDAPDRAELIALTRGTCDVEERSASAGLEHAQWLDAQRAFVGMRTERLLEIAVERPRVERELAGAARAVSIAREGNAYVVFAGEWARARDADGSTPHAHVANPVDAGGVICGGRALLGTRQRSVLVSLPAMTTDVMIEGPIEWAACAGDHWIVGRRAQPALLIDADARVVRARISFPEERSPERSEAVRWLRTTNELVYTAASRVWRVTLPTD